MIALLTLARDTLGWWGALAWIITLDDVICWLRTPPEKRRTKAVNPVVATVAMGVLSMGLILLGTTLPLNTRIPAFATDTVAFWAALAFGWALIAVAGWAFVIARALRPAMLTATALLALGGTALAAALTAGGA